MASVIPIGKKWRAQVRRQGFPARTETFPTKILADKWARRVESEMDAGRAGVPAASGVTLEELISRYTEEVGKSRPFGANKREVLVRMSRLIGKLRADKLTSERVVEYIREDRGIKGPAATIDLCYLKVVLKLARALWRHPVNPQVVDDAREILKHMNLLDKANRRDRRPTPEELVQLRAWFAEHSSSLTPDVFDFILASCFRPPSEVRRLRWADLNEADRTIVIHDRKDPRRKLGNDQIVPLLNGSFEIVMRQPRTSDVIFPCGERSWSTLFPRATHALGIDDLCMYDLRHEAISRLVESNKYSIPEMMLVTGHKDPKQLMTYTQLQARNLHDR